MIIIYFCFLAAIARAYSVIMIRAKHIAQFADTQAKIQMTHTFPAFSRTLYLCSRVWETVSEIFQSGYRTHYPNFVIHPKATILTVNERTKKDTKITHIHIDLYQSVSVLLWAWALPNVN